MSTFDFRLSTFDFQLSIFLLFALLPAVAHADESRSITDTRTEWPSTEQFVRVLTLQDHNTRVVILGVAMLGLASGLIGSFLLLRKRALLGDAISHATLPGIGLAFIVMTAFGIDGKYMPGLLFGATVFGVFGILAILAIVHTTRIKQDAALGIVLSVFFGLGVAVLGIVQQLPTASAAGLESFIYGKAASMLASESWIITGAAGVIALACLAMFKEFGLLCFDADFAAAQGRRVVLLDALLMTLVVGVTVIGLQAVGLILVVALLIIPPAAARFWTHHLPTMVVAAAILGALSGVIGAGLSALLPRLPAGGIIVVTAGVFFFISMVFGSAKGVLVQGIDRRRVALRVARQHLLRGLYELSEGAEGVEGSGLRVEGSGFRGQGEERGATGSSRNLEPRASDARIAVSISDLRALRGWSAAGLALAVRRAIREGLVRTSIYKSHLTLTPDGIAVARRLVRNHRLWELFLIHYADIAPSHVDRDADDVEHILGPEMTDELEAIMAADVPAPITPGSPHEVAARR